LNQVFLNSIIFLTGGNILAKTRRRPATQTKSKSPISPVLIGVVVVAAVLVVSGLIVLGNQRQAVGQPVEASEFPTLGDPSAPVTIVEYSDYG
jgi:protein-disulfide isomerase